MSDAPLSLNDRRLICRGEWTVHRLQEIMSFFDALTWPYGEKIAFDGSEMTRLDIAAAWLLLDWQHRLEKKGLRVHYESFPTHAMRVLEWVGRSGVVGQSLETRPASSGLFIFLARLGAGLDTVMLYLAFIGRVSGMALKMMMHPSLIRLPLFSRQIILSGYKALPIIGLLSCMVGVVLGYQLGIQLRNYGANVFVADLVGMSVLREFGPLLTAIMVAGRTGSSFTAELGMMKINQEIDALQTMGISPELLLVIPRVFGLFIVLPLLTIWADIFGVLGGMFMAGNVLDVTAYDFLIRLQHQVPLRMLLMGLGKSLVFALIIAAIGCFEGMTVASNADSLGRNTTRSVVFAIFVIIVTDAAFSILFSRLRL